MNITLHAPRCAAAALLACLSPLAAAEGGFTLVDGDKGSLSIYGTLDGGLLSRSGSNGAYAAQAGTRFAGHTSELASGIAVSYTHLDVYKRQASRSMRTGRRFLSSTCAASSSVAVTSCARCTRTASCRSCLKVSSSRSDGRAPRQSSGVPGDPLLLLRRRASLAWRR